MTQAETIMHITDEAQALEAARSTALTADHPTAEMTTFGFDDGSRIAFSEGKRWHMDPDAVTWFAGYDIRGLWA